MREEQLGASSGCNPAIPLPKFLVWLHSVGSQRCMLLWRELVVWLACCIEWGSWWARASGDALDTPAPQGVSRVRRLNPHLVDAMGQAAGSGELGRTGAKIGKVLRFAFRRRGGKQGMAVRTANRVIKDRPKRYRECCQEAFHHSKVRIVSIAMDATRVSGRDTQYHAAFAPELQRACWADPQVPQGREWKG